MQSVNSEDIGCSLETHVHTAILEAFREDFLDNALVLLLNYARGGGKYPEGTFSHARVCRLAGLEEGCQQFRPVFVFTVLATEPFVHAMPSYVPLSVYCLAISAMASPILFRTWLTCSVARH